MSAALFNGKLLYLYLLSQSISNIREEYSKANGSKVLSNLSVSTNIETSINIR